MSWSNGPVTVDIDEHFPFTILEHLDRVWSTQPGGQALYDDLSLWIGERGLATPPLPE